MPMFSAISSCGRAKPVDADQPEALHAERGGEVDAEVQRVDRRHHHDADIEVGDLEADRGVAQLGRLVGVDPAVTVAVGAGHLLVAVDIGPVRPADTHERGHIGRADGHRGDGLVAAVGQRHVLRRPELEATLPLSSDFGIAISTSPRGIAASHLR